MDLRAAQQRIEREKAAAEARAAAEKLRRDSQAERTRREYLEQVATIDPVLQHVIKMLMGRDMRRRLTRLADGSGKRPNFSFWQILKNDIPRSFCIESSYGASVSFQLTDSYKFHNVYVPQIAGNYFIELIEPSRWMIGCRVSKDDYPFWYRADLISSPIPTPAVFGSDDYHHAMYNCPLRENLSLTGIVEEGIVILADVLNVSLDLFNSPRSSL